MFTRPKSSLVPLILSSLLLTQLVPSILSFGSRDQRLLQVNTFGESIAAKPALCAYGLNGLFDDMFLVFENSTASLDRLDGLDFDGTEWRRLFLMEPTSFSYNPALTVFQSELWAATTAHHANTSNPITFRTYNGTVWSGLSGAPWYTSGAINPAVASFQYAGPLRVYYWLFLFWQTLENEVYCTAYESRDGWLSTPIAVAQGAAEVEPAACVFDKLYVVWVSNNTMVYKTFDGTAWSPAGNIYPEPASLPRNPSLTVFNGRLYVAYEAEDQVYLQAFDGVEWTSPSKLIAPQMTPKDPAICSYNNLLYIVYTSQGQLYYQTYDEKNWSDPKPIPPTPLYTLHVRVQEAENTPVENASVSIDGRPAGQTNVEGELNIYNVTPGTHSILVTKEGYQDEEEEINVASNMTVTVTLKLAVKMPDLSIQTLSFEPPDPRVGEPVQTSITIQNIGNATASAFHWSWKPLPEIDPIEGYIEEGLEVNAFTTVYANYTYQEAGEYLTTASADSKGEVEEADEQNNEANQTIIVKPTVAVYSLAIRVTDHNGSVIEEATVFLDEVYAGRTDAQGKVLVENVPEGTHPLLVRAEGFEQEKRTVELVSDTLVTVVLNPRILSSLPDLIMWEFEVTQLKPAEGDEVGLTCVVENADGGEAQNVSIQLQIDGKEVAEAFLENLSTGQKTEVEWSWTATEAELLHELVAIADPENRIEESNEDNNALYRVMYVERSNKTFKLTVRVNEADSVNPVEDAAICLNDELVGSTSGEGLFIIENVFGGTYSVIATKKGYTYGKKNVTVTSDIEVQIVLTLAETPTLQPDLSVLSVNVSHHQPVVGEEVTVEVVFINDGDCEAANFSVSLQINEREVANQTVDKLQRGEEGRTGFAWTPDHSGLQNLTITVDANHDVDESDENNNSQSQSVEVVVVPAGSQANTLTPWTSWGEQSSILAPFENLFMPIYSLLSSVITSIAQMGHAPDLVVTELVQEHVPAGIFTPQTWRWRVTVKNVGNSPTKHPFFTGVYLRSDVIDRDIPLIWGHSGQSQWSEETRVPPDAPPVGICDERLSPGDSYTFTIPQNVWARKLYEHKDAWEGRPQIVVKVDPFDDNLELMEQNNERLGLIPAAYVSGFVCDADGCPLEGATLQWTDGWAALGDCRQTLYSAVRTDDDGYYEGVLIYLPTTTVPISTLEWSTGIPDAAYTDLPAPEMWIMTPHPWVEQRVYRLYHQDWERSYDPADEELSLLIGSSWEKLAPPPSRNTYPELVHEMVYRSPDPADPDGVHCEVESHLAQEYNPIFYYDHLEDFFPADPATYMRNAELWQLVTTIGEVPIFHSLVESDLTADDVGSVHTYRIEDWRARPENQYMTLDKDGLSYEDFQQESEELYGAGKYGTANPPVFAQVYVPDYDPEAQIHPNDLKYGIRYCLFYEYNPHPEFPDHEGDWEKVCVYVKRGDIIHMHFHKHVFASNRIGAVGQAKFLGNVLEATDPNLIVNVPDSLIQRQGKHPIVYVARGSHAAYHESGATEIEFKGVSGWCADVAAKIANYGKAGYWWGSLWVKTTRAHPGLTGESAGHATNEGHKGTDYHDGYGPRLMFPVHVIRDVQEMDLPGYETHGISTYSRAEHQIDYDLLRFQGKWGLDYVIVTAGLDFSWKYYLAASVVAIATGGVGVLALSVFLDVFLDWVFTGIAITQDYGFKWLSVGSPGSVNLHATEQVP